MYLDPLLYLVYISVGFHGNDVGVSVIPKEFLQKLRAESCKCLEFRMGTRDMILPISRDYIIVSSNNFDKTVQTCLCITTVIGWCPLFFLFFFYIWSLGRHVFPFSL